MIEVNLIDSMGSDLSVVNAARVSFGKVSEMEYNQWGPPTLKDKDAKLIRYLAKHKHLSPFGHCFASFHVKAPVFVARQLVKHKFLRWNEISRRYVSDDPEFYTPVLREATSDKKQGSGCDMGLPSLDGVLANSQREALKDYKYLLNMGVCEEQARVVLPLSHMTEWYWSGSLDAFADMCNLRCTADTQVESRAIADQVDAKIAQVYPVSWEALRS